MSLLEKFDVSLGKLNDFGVVDLDFRRQANLKQIIITQVNCRHYFFYYDFGRYWKNLNVPL